jgi:parvulin-like peptidyl-prolyl isomerase
MNSRPLWAWSMLSSTRARQHRRRIFSVRKLALILFLCTLGLGLAACGGSDENVPDGAVAVVGDQEISKAEFDAIMGRAQTAFKQQKRPFPKTGTPEYKALQNQAIQYLVQQAKYREKADELDIKVTDKEIDDRLKQVKQQYFGGSEEKYKQNLKQQNITEEDLRTQIENQLISEKIYDKVTEGLKVSDSEIGTYYKSHQKDYKVAESREVRHILVNKKALADDLRSQLANGGSWTTLAKKYSKDPSSKDSGGKLTVRKGETVPEFDKTAFALDKNEISQPVKTQYGYHIIQALGDIQPEKQTPLKDVKEQIRQQLLQEKRQKAVAEWSKDLNKEFAKKISYQVGYAPPATTGTTTATQ